MIIPPKVGSVADGGSDFIEIAIESGARYFQGFTNVADLHFFVIVHCFGHQNLGRMVQILKWNHFHTKFDNIFEWSTLYIAFLVIEFVIRHAQVDVIEWIDVVSLAAFDRRVGWPLTVV